MLNIDVNVHMEDFADALDRKAEAIVAAVRGEMTVQTGNLLAFIKDDKLSGQVLNQRTGNLKNSGFTEQTEEAGEVVGFVGFGRTAPYAAIHNYGGTIEIPEVTGKLMVFQREGRTVFTMRHKAFTVTMPARNFLESSAEEQAPVIREGFEAVVAEAANA